MTSSPDSPSIAFLTLGCPKNEVDSDRMRAALVAAGFSVADDDESADVVVVNTCSFIEAATAESIETVLDLASSWLPKREGRRLIVAGCMPSRYGADLAAAMPEVDAFVPVAEEGALVETLKRLTGFSAAETPGKCPPRSTSGPSAYLQISDGCHRECAYCTIPSIRGPYVSRPLDAIVDEARELVRLGAVEVVLIGQDTTSWGRDLPGKPRLASVVRAVAAVPGVARLRIMYAQPDGIDDELLAAMAETPNVCRYLDMPLQHASKSVLRAMRRSGDGESYLRLVGRIREAMPDVALRTTLIAGFPGETRADVKALEDFVRAARFDYVGIFAFSSEEGTSAASMDAQVPARTRRARAQRLRDLADSIGFEKASERVGDTLSVLVEGIDEDDGVVFGRWCGQAPEIDGVVLLDGGEVGKVLSAVIVDSLGYDLEGEVLR